MKTTASAEQNEVHIAAFWRDEAIRLIGEGKDEEQVIQSLITAGVSAWVAIRGVEYAAFVLECVVKAMRSAGENPDIAFIKTAVGSVH